MALQYKKSALPNKYSPICQILWLTKKGKTLTKNVIISALPIKYIICFPPSFALIFLDVGFNSSLPYAHISCHPVENIKTQYLNISYLLHYSRP